MPVLLGMHEACAGHVAGPHHPESPDRLAAADRGASAAGLGTDLVPFVPRAASDGEIVRVHSNDYLVTLERFCAAGGGRLDSDTSAVAASMTAARFAAGAGLDAVQRLRAGEAEAAFLAVRPPGHHALRERPMGFCLLNNIAITAASLVADGERVLIVDIDAHHGNGTQAAFYADPAVLFVSLHQYPFYPGTGGVTEIGEGPGLGSTMNFPFPAGTSGDAYRMAFDEAVVPAAELFSPTWLLVSAGFDAHRDDPLTDLGLSAGDYGDLTARLMYLAPPGRRIFFLEGGYALLALERCVATSVAALGGHRLVTEGLTSGDVSARGAAVGGGPAAVVLAARDLHAQNAT